MTPVYIKVVFTLILLVTITLFTLKAPETPIFIVKYPGLDHKTQKSSFPKINKNYTENHYKSLPQIVHNKTELFTCKYVVPGNMCGGKQKANITIETVAWTNDSFWLKPLEKVEIKKINLENADKTVFKPESPVIFFWHEPFQGFDHHWKNGFCGENDKCILQYGPYENENVYQTAAKSDVIVMSPVFDPGLNKLDFDRIKRIRTKNQIWVWFQWESPQFHSIDLRKYDNFFNATLSYRFDSTFWFPYSSMIMNKLKWLNSTEPSDKNLDKNVKNSLKNLKPNQLGVAAAISNCASAYRGKLVRKLSNLIKFPNGTKALDVFGACKDRYQKYPSKNRDYFIETSLKKGFWELPKVLKNYKFYFAFENSRCRNYITEKFFSNAFLSNSIPIVAGPPRSDYEYVAPKDSFIHVDDFRTVNDLAERINFLLDDKNEAEYLKFFEWKNKLPDDSYHLSSFKEHKSSGLCGLCQAAFEIKNDVKFWKLEIIPDLHSWWYGKRQETKDLRGRWKSMVNRNTICLENNRHDIRRRKKRQVSDLIYL